MQHKSIGCLIFSVLCWEQVKDCARLPASSSFILHTDYQHWRMLQHGSLGQCSLCLLPWTLRCNCTQLYPMKGSPQISYAACWQVTTNYTKYEMLPHTRPLCKCEQKIKKRNLLKASNAVASASVTSYRCFTNFSSAGIWLLIMSRREHLES